MPSTPGNMILSPLRYIKGAITLAFSTALIWALSLPAWSLIEATEAQRDTVVEMLDQLQERHYAGLAYADELSSPHLDNYIKSQLDHHSIKALIVEADPIAQKIMSNTFKESDSLTSLLN